MNKCFEPFGIGVAGLLPKPRAETRDVRWSKFVGTGKERNTIQFKKDLSLSRFFLFSLS